MGDISWQKPVTITKPREWKDFIDLLEAKILTQYKIKIARHFGVPVKFPCLVYCLVDYTQRFVEHKFIYPEDAYGLIKIHKEINSRLALILQDIEEENEKSMAIK